MDVKWQFEPKRKSQKSRDPMQASFFTNSSIDDDTHALVREAIQNSLDAKSAHCSDALVHTRFHVGTHIVTNSDVMDRYISDDAWEHFNSPDNGLKSPPTVADDCRYLIYEDFNTTGLIGDERAYEAESKNSFYYFMRSEGQSGKEEGERGRHGIGKYVFPYTSGIRMFIAATVRDSDGRVLVAGQSVLKSHHVGDEQFTPDGWWGEFEKDGEADYFQLPSENNQLFHQLQADFELERELEQSGLSLILPYVQKEVTAEKLVEHVIKEYFWPILNGQLTVDISDENTTKKVNADTIRTNLDALLPASSIEKVSPFINVAVKAIENRNCPIVSLNLPSSHSLPRWDNLYLNKEIALTVREKLSNHGDCLCIRCPLYVKPQDNEGYQESYFDIFISKNLNDDPRKPLFIREGITIPEDRVQMVRGYTSIVVIEPGPLATLLGDSENPAHTEWEKNATKFKGKYRWGPTTIDFVRLSVAKLLHLISQGDEEEDLKVLSDIFFLDLPENDDDVPQPRKRRKKKQVGNDDEPRPDPPPPVQKSYRLIKKEGGFLLRGPRDPMDKKRQYQVRVAYDFFGASKNRAIKRYHKNDFDLSRSKNVNNPISSGIENFNVDSNCFEFISDDHNFFVEVTGFDNNRDIIVDVDSRVVIDEAV